MRTLGPSNVERSFNSSPPKLYDTMVPSLTSIVLFPLPTTTSSTARFTLYSRCPDFAIAPVDDSAALRLPAVDASQYSSGSNQYHNSSK